VSVTPAGRVVVTLGIYSGRPDPTWTLTDAEASTLDTMLAALVDLTDTPLVGGLGYHGFTIVGPTGTLAAYGGAVAPPGEGPRAMKSDPTRSIERFLLETSRAYVTPAEYAAAERGIGAP
jgi:hypothetical protein